MEYEPAVIIANALSSLNETMVKILLVLERTSQPLIPLNNDDGFIEALRDVTEYAARNTCLHEETCRGGAIWEICQSCGMKWADDEGGKPANANDMPGPIQRAYDVLERLG